MDKIELSNFFKTKKAREIADLIAIKIEETNCYYIYKNRYGSSRKFVDSIDFDGMLRQSKRPIILSDIYIIITD